jgi:hypothetical protein
MSKNRENLKSLSYRSIIRRTDSLITYFNEIFLPIIETILNYLVYCQQIHLLDETQVNLINNIRETINQFVQRFASPGTHINLNANLNMNSNVLIIHLRGQLYLFAHYLDNNDSVSRLNNYIAQQQFISETQTSITNYLNSHQYTNAWQSFVPQTEQQEQEEEVVSPQQSHVEKGSDEDLSR